MIIEINTENVHKNSNLIKYVCVFVCIYVYVPFKLRIVILVKFRKVV